jgi:hypothetical protein
MVREERTNFRDQEYSNWHRTIGESYSMYDIDSIEFRWDGRGIVAIIELKKNIGGIPKDDQGKVYLIIARALNIPYYLVQYEEGMNEISVFKYNDNGLAYNKKNWKQVKKQSGKPYLPFNKKEYGEFLKGL